MAFKTRQQKVCLVSIQSGAVSSEAASIETFYQNQQSFIFYHAILEGALSISIKKCQQSINKYLLLENMHTAALFDAILLAQLCKL